MLQKEIREIGISAPASTTQLAELIYDYNPSMPEGLGAVPVNNLIKELICRGYKVTVFSLSPDVPKGKIEVIKGKNLTIYYGHYRSSARLRKLDFFLEERKELAKCISMAKPDIIHAHWQYEFAWPAINSGIECVLTCHDAPLQVLKLQIGMYRFVRLLMAMRNLRKFRHINAVSPYAVVENEKLTRQKIDLIPNFEPQWVFDLYRPKKLDGPIKIAMINQGFDGRKNVGIGVKAFNLLLERYPDAELHLFGEDNGANQAAGIYARKHKVERNVHFHGEVPFMELMKIFSNCHVFLHTALEESCPMVVIEAMALGIPVIGGDKSGGVPWMLSDGGGLLTDITNPEAVTDTLLKMLEPDYYVELSNEARNIAMGRFHPSVIVKKHIESYRKALKK